MAIAVLVGVFAAPGFADPAFSHSSKLLRYPYLTDVVGTSATVVWATDTSTTIGGKVKYGKVQDGSCTTSSKNATRSTITVNSVSEYRWKASLTLEPDTEYCYRVYLGSPEEDLLDQDSSPHFFTQIPAGSSEPFSFLVFGDWGEVDAAGANPDQANLMSQIAQSGARFGLTTGDNAYPAGSQTNYGDLVQTGAGISAIFGPSFWKGPGASLPLFPALGNHGISGANTHFVNWPQDSAVSSSGGRYVNDTYCCLNGTQSAIYGSAWYAFDAGNTRFYVLHAAWSDTNNGTASSYQNDYDYHWTPTSPEYQWLQNDLATHPSQLKFAVVHYPFYSDQKKEPADPFLRGPNSLEGLLSANGVDIAFNGHSHIYQRNLKPDPSSLVTYVTGGGGARLQAIGEAGCSPVDAYGIGWAVTANKGSKCGSAVKPTSKDQVYHFLKVSVDGHQVTVTPTDSMGHTFDEVTYDFDPSHPYSPKLRRYPYLTDVVGTSATVVWATDTSVTTSRIRYGKVQDGSCITSSKSAAKSTITVNGVTENRWKVRLTLEPDTEYCYRIYAGSAQQEDLLGPGASPHFFTQIPAGTNEPFSFLVFGNWGEVDASGANPDQANLMDQMAQSGARFALTTGDNAHPAGSQTNYGDLVQAGPNMSAVFGPSFWKGPGASLPIFPALGNRGMNDSNTHFLSWPQDSAVSSSGGKYVNETYCCLNGTSSRTYGSAWYAFDAGNARFYVLKAAWSDTNVGTATTYKNDYDYHWTPTSAEYQWLANDLATHPSQLKFAVFHYPVYSDSQADPSDTFLQSASPPEPPSSLEGLLSANGVDVGFTGHAGIYQRNVKAHANSLVTYVTGAGGAKPAGIGTGGCSAVDAYGIGWSDSTGTGTACGEADPPASKSEVTHFLKVSVDGAQVTVTPTNSLGQTFDPQSYDFSLPP